MWNFGDQSHLRSARFFLLLSVFDVISVSDVYVLCMCVCIWSVSLFSSLPFDLWLSFRYNGVIVDRHCFVIVIYLPVYLYKCSVEFGYSLHSFVPKTIRTISCHCNWCAFAHLRVFTCSHSFMCVSFFLFFTLKFTCPLCSSSSFVVVNFEFHLSFFVVINWYSQFIVYTETHRCRRSVKEKERERENVIWFTFCIVCWQLTWIHLRFKTIHK